MKTKTTFTFSHSELSAFAFITWNVSAYLLQSKNDLQRLAGLHIHKLHHRLNEKISVTFAGKKSARLNLYEILSLHSFIQVTSVHDDVYTSTVRNSIFTQLDKML